MKSKKVSKILLILTLALSFGPLLYFAGYILVISLQLFPGYFHFWPSASGYGLIWGFVAFIVAIYSLYNRKRGGVIAIIIGILFIVPVILRHHYADLYVPIASVYTVGGMVNLVYSKLYEFWNW